MLPQCSFCCPPLPISITETCIDFIFSLHTVGNSVDLDSTDAMLYQQLECGNALSWENPHNIIESVDQSAEEQPRHPQPTHSMSWPSFSCAWGTRHIHVALKFVSLVCMHRRQHSYCSKSGTKTNNPMRA